ncbi:alpha/beta fold hydrolase [Promicromonospora sp. NPDC060204]|uniref:alpha/beta fold hydrolase n=1 Tax=Promicromonospora sp. NPDC060204 TaxID=3347071 RepID=UPI0036563378
MRNIFRRSPRRSALAIVTLVMLLTGGGGLATAQTLTARDTATKPTVVLVHGAWADAGGFADVETALHVAGYPVLEFANPLRSLSSDSAALGAYLQQRTDGPVILVGHSYGGAVITDAALTDPDVKALVYIDAFVPDAGESLTDLLGRQGPVNPTQLFDVVANPGAPEGDVDLYLKDAVFPVAFANGLPRITQAQLLASQRPIAAAALAEPSTQPAWKSLPSWYVLGTNDQIVSPELQRFMAERAGAKITTVGTGHLAMIARPDVVTATILRADRATR